MNIGKPKIPKITTPMAVVLESHIGGDNIAYRAGDKFRADHFDVIRHPEFYCEDGLATDEIAALHQARFDIERRLQERTS